MTISSTNRKAGPYAGNGSSTVFPFSFKIFSASDLYVTRTSSEGAVVVLDLGTDFTVSLNANQDDNPGGTVTLSAALESGYSLTVTSYIQPLQPVELTNLGGFYPRIINDALDRLTILIQQLITNGITSGSIGGVITGARNLGTSLGFFKAKVGEELHFRGVEAGVGISLLDTGNTIRISAEGGGTGSGEANTTSNLGAGYGIAAPKAGVDLPLKSLKAGSGVSMSATADEITINATGGGGGSWDGFADISTFGAVADFVPAAGGLGTGTSNDAAIMAAIATGKPLYIPDGNYYVANWSTRLAFSRATVLGFSTGHVWGDTGRGKQILGKTLFVGSTNTHEISYAGGIFWAPDGSSNGIRQWTGHHNWMVLQPDAGPMQLQLYPGGKGQAITASCEAPNKLNAVYGTFDTSLLRPGMEVGWYGKVYKVDSVVSGTQITVANYGGGSPGFVTSATQRAFYCFYEYSRFQANVSGATVTRLSGDALPYGYSGDHMFCLVNGNYYTVTQGPESTGNPSTLTLSSGAGTLTGANCEFFRAHGPWAYVTLFRLQGVAGGVETNGGMALNIKNELRIWNGGTHDELMGDILLNGNEVRIGRGYGDAGETDRFSVTNSAVYLGASTKNSSTRNHLVALPGDVGYAAVLAKRGAENSQGMGFDLQGNSKYSFTYNTFGNTGFEVYCTSSADTWCTATSGTGKAVFSVNSGTNNGDVELAPGGTGKTNVRRMPFVKLRMVGALRLEIATLIPWDTEVSDIFGMHAPNDTKIYVPVSGLYRVSAQFQALFYGAAASRTSVSTRIDIKKNGVGTMAELGCMTQHRYESDLVAGSNQTYDLVLAAGDYIEIRAVQLSYGSGDSHADIDTTDAYTWVTVALVTGT